MCEINLQVVVIFLENNHFFVITIVVRHKRIKFLIAVII